MNASPLISIEGIDGSGKTTLIKGIQRLYPKYNYLNTNGCGFPEFEGIFNLSSLEQTLLHCVRHLRIRDQHDKLHGPSIVDRYSDSTLAYQGPVYATLIKQIGITKPDATLLLDVDPWRAAHRVNQRGEEENTGDLDFCVVQDRYRHLQRMDDLRVFIINANHGQQHVLEQAVTILHKLYPLYF